MRRTTIVTTMFALMLSIGGTTNAVEPICTNELKNIQRSHHKFVNCSEFIVVSLQDTFEILKTTNFPDKVHKDLMMEQMKNTSLRTLKMMECIMGFIQETASDIHLLDICIHTNEYGRHNRR